MPGNKADGAKMACSCEGLVPEGNLVIVERYEDKADAQQATRLKAARHFPQIRKHCSERTLATNYAPKSADACAPFGFGFAKSASASTDPQTLGTAHLAQESTV